MAKEPMKMTDWNAVAARALALQAMHLAGFGEKRITDKAQFLMVLGLNRADAAALLGSSDDSLRIHVCSRDQEGSHAIGETHFEDR